MGRLTIVALAVVGFGVTEVEAQVAEELTPGRRVRIVSPAARGEFVVQSADAAQLVLARQSSSETQIVPTTTVSRIHVFEGRRSRGRSAARGMVIGALIGGASGAAVGFADGDSPCVRTNSCFIWDDTAENKAAMIGFLLGSAGAVVGGVAGALAPGEKWKQVHASSRVSITPRAGGPALSIGF